MDSAVCQKCNILLLSPSIFENHKRYIMDTKWTLGQWFQISLCPFSVSIWHSLHPLTPVKWLPSIQMQQNREDFALSHNITDLNESLHVDILWWQLPASASAVGLSSTDAHLLWQTLLISLLPSLSSHFSVLIAGEAIQPLIKLMLTCTPDRPATQSGKGTVRQAHHVVQVELLPLVHVVPEAVQRRGLHHNSEVVLVRAP